MAYEQLSLQIHGGNVLGQETASYIWARSDTNVLIVNVIHSDSSNLLPRKEVSRNPLKESALHKYLRSSQEKVRRGEKEKEVDGQTGVETIRPLLLM